MDESKIVERIIAQLANEKTAGIKEDYDIEISGHTTGGSVHISLWMVFKDPNNFNRTRHRNIIKSAHKILLKTVNEEIENNPFFEISSEFSRVNRPVKNIKTFTGECYVVISEVKKNPVEIVDIFTHVRKKLYSLL